MIKKLLVSACVLLSFSVLATTLPPITIYIGYTPGSNSDKILRAVQVELQKEIQNPIRVDYKPGAGGDVAVGFIANNTKKETTLLITNINLPWWNITKNTHYDYRTLLPVAYLGTTPQILVSPPSTGLRTKSDWDKLDSTIPVSYGSSGYGSSTHLDGEILFYKSNKKMLHIPYKGGSELLPDLLSGRIKTAYSFRLSVEGFINEGKLIPFAVAASRRLKSLPNIPTLDELGMTDSWIPVWQILVANPGADPELVKQVQNALIKIYNDPKRRDNFSEISDLQLEPNNIILKPSFIQEQVDIYKDYAKKIPTFSQKE
jgi:tripartite-type tricarboxylate transporter receptor subunit TctC